MPELRPPGAWSLMCTVVPWARRGHTTLATSGRAHMCWGRAVGALEHAPAGQEQGQSAHPVWQVGSAPAQGWVVVRTPPPGSQGVGEVSEPLSPHLSISLCISLRVSPSVSLCLSLSPSPAPVCLSSSLWLSGSGSLSQHFFFVSFYSLPYPPFPHFSVVSSAAVCAFDFLSLFLYVSLRFRLLLVSVCSVPGCCLFLQFLCVSVLQIFFLINLSSFWLFLRRSHTCTLLPKLFTLWRMPFLFSLQSSKLLFILKNTAQKPQTTCWSFP